MATSSPSSSINDLADLSLALIFAFLPPDERVRLERVCRKWRKIVKKHAWTEFRTLTMDRQELAQRGHKALPKYRALIIRCAPHLHQLRFSLPWEFDVDHWSMMRNLRHLRFDVCVSPHTLRAVADNLSRLQSIHFSDIDWRSIPELHHLLRVDNASLQALHLPLFDSQRDSFPLSALPSSLHSLNIDDLTSSNSWIISDADERKRDRIDELLELAASCCPQLAMLMLPLNFTVSGLSLAKLARFEKLLYVRLRLPQHQSYRELFGNSLAKNGAQLMALLLERVDSKVLHLIAKHCPQLEHCYFEIVYCPEHAVEGLSSALKSVLQLAHLRSVSIRYNYYCEMMHSEILAITNGLNAKGKIEYLRLSLTSPLHVEFITNLILNNPKLRKLTCAIRRDHTPAELSKLKKLLQNMDGPMELELDDWNCPPELKMGENCKVQVRESISSSGSISQPMLRQFWARAMDSVPNLGNLDD